MQIEFSLHDEILIVTPLATSLDASVTADFKTAVLAEIGNARPPLILNLDNIDFVDSSGLGSVLSIYKHLGEEHLVVICSVRPNVMQLFKLTRLNRIFVIVPSLPEALAHLKDPGSALDSAS